MATKIQIRLLLLAVWSAQGTLAETDPQASLGEPDIRVVGGSDVPEGAVKYLVSIRTLDNAQFCGGTIIADKWILTAAHCIDGDEPGDIFAVAGSVSRSKGNFKYKFDKLILHEKYDIKPLVHDIALCRTKEKIAFNHKVQALALPTEDVKPKTNALLAGWGFTDQKGKQVSDTMKWLNVTTISIDDCRKYLKSNLKNFPINNENVCTSRGAGYGLCQGDSGGGLQSNNKVIGVVSWNVPCARGYPDVYTNVYTHASWLTETMDKNK